jgi:hypothetical protein
MQLDRSGTGIRSVPEGLALSPPTVPEHRAIFDSWRVVRPVVETDDGFLLRIDQVDHVDTQDRVVVGAGMVKSMLEAGL